MSLLEERWYPNGSGPTVIANWRRAEDTAAQWLRRLGYPDARTTDPGPDEGIDVDAVGAVAQVKNRASKRTSIQAVQRIAGVAQRGQTPFFFSTGGYTNPALKWARKPRCSVALFVLRHDGRVKPVNRAAIEALREAPILGNEEPTPRRIRSLLPTLAFTCSVIGWAMGVFLTTGLFSKSATPEVKWGIGLMSMVFLLSGLGAANLFWELLRPRLRFSLKPWPDRLFDPVVGPPAQPQDANGPAFQFNGLPGSKRSVGLRRQYLMERHRLRTVRYLRSGR